MLALSTFSVYIERFRLFSIPSHSKSAFDINLWSDHLHSALGLLRSRAISDPKSNKK